MKGRPSRIRAATIDTVGESSAQVQVLKRSTSVGPVKVSDITFRTDLAVEPVPSATIRKAIELIEADPRAPHSISDLAAQCGVGARALQHVTAAEWGEMAAASSTDIEPERMPLLFGLMTYEGDPEVTREVIEHMPPEIRPIMAGLSTEAFARHAELVHGTPTPAKSGELHG